MGWSHEFEIINEFDLKSQSSDLEGIISELKILRNKYHPNGNSKKDGTFESEEEKEKYYRIIDALEFCENKVNNNLLILTQTKEIVSYVSGLIQNESVDKQILEAPSYWKANNSKKTFIPKLSLSLITTVLFFIFLFPQTFSDHPYIAPIINNEYFYKVWFGLLWMIICIWIAFFFTEYFSDKIINKLFDEDFHIQVLKSLYNEHGECKSRFSKKDVFVQFEEPVYKFTKYGKSILKIPIIRVFVRLKTNKFRPFDTFVRLSGFMVIILLGVIVLYVAIIEKGVNISFHAFNFSYYVYPEFFFLYTFSLSFYIPMLFVSHYISQNVIENACMLFLKKYEDKNIIKRCEDNSAKYFIETGIDNYYIFVD